MPERWSDDTAELVDAVINVSGSVPDARKRADLTDAILAALADAGLLVQPGCTVRARWMAEYFETWPGETRRRRRTRIYATEQEADNWLAQCGPDESPRKLRRFIYVGPFEPTDTKEPSPDA